MAHNEVVIAASPEAVFAVLSDGARYADWVVGAKHIRDVDPGFPAEGTAIHHTIGAGPVTVDDTTDITRVVEDRKLTMLARVGLAGKARIDLELRPEQGGTRVLMDEKPVSGLARRLHNPIADLILRARNAEALRRLRRVVEAESA